MEHKHITNDMMELMEQEMLLMWQSGEAKHILKDDPGFIKVILSAIFYQKQYWKAMGLTFGEG
jgi:hypothetical protein